MTAGIVGGDEAAAVIDTGTTEARRRRGHERCRLRLVGDEGASHRETFARHSADGREAYPVAAYATGTFWLTRKRFAGSYWRFTWASRS